MDEASADRYQRMRNAMVEQQLEARGISDERVLQAMRRVPRHLFVPQPGRDRAYEDTPLSIGEGATISQPYMVAWMTQLLEMDGDETVLEIGTGSGYQAAILGVLAKKVYTIERVVELGTTARKRLEEFGFKNIEVMIADGSRGLPEKAPFDRILVTAGSPGIPEVLVEQLADGGRLVIPVGDTSMQMLTVLIRHGNDVERREEGSCVFVPLVGMYGWEGP